jgi:hypothetical protein
MKVLARIELFAVLPPVSLLGLETLPQGEAPPPTAEVTPARIRNARGGYRAAN